MLGTSTPYGAYLAVLAPDNNGCAMAYDLVEPACCRKSWISCMRSPNHLRDHMVSLIGADMMSSLTWILAIPTISFVHLPPHRPEVRSAHLRNVDVGAFNMSILVKSLNL